MRDELPETLVSLNPDGTTDVFLPELDPDESEPTLFGDVDHFENLVYYLDEDDLQMVASEVIDGYDEDEVSRNGHISQIIDAVSSLGLGDDDAAIFEGACTVVHPLLMENSVKMQAKASGELLPSGGPVKAQILGDPDDELETQAQRVQEYLNYQVTRQMPEYYPNTEKALMMAALTGNAFKKKHIDADRVRDSVINIDRLVVNNCCESLHTADRITEVLELSEVQVRRYQYTGLFADDVPLGEPARLQKTELQNAIDTLLGMDSEAGEGYTVLEQHVFMDLPGFEFDVPLPYIIHVDKRTSQVLSIRRNYEEGQPFQKKEYYTHYGFVPFAGFYHLGYIHLLGNFQRTLTAVLRSLVDAGQFANLQGGFKSKNMKFVDEDSPLAPGEFRDVESLGNDLSKSIMALPFKDPSSTLFNLLQFIESRGQKFADSTEQILADSTNYGPVGTTMALLDASTKFFSAVFKRFHAAQAQELSLIAGMNYDTLPIDENSIPVNLPGKTLRISREDFSDRIDILPVSDPNISSQAHRLTLAQTKLQAALQAPGIHNLREAYRDFYIALGEGNKVDKLLPAPQQAQPSDPLTEVQMAVQGIPIHATPEQDHDAHIQIKQSFIDTMGADQNMAQAVPALQANIREHMVLIFAANMQGAMSLGLDASQAANEVRDLMKFKQENPLGMQDPKQILAQAELMNARTDAAKLQLDQQELENDTLIDLMKASVNVRQQNIDLAKHEMKLENDRELAKFNQSVQMIREGLKDA